MGADQLIVADPRPDPSHTRIGFGDAVITPVGPGGGAGGGVGVGVGVGFGVLQPLVVILVEICASRAPVDPFVR